MSQKNIDYKVPKKRSSLSMLRVLDLLSVNKTPKQIASILNVSQATVSYHLRNLRALGNIQKIGYGVWEVLEKNIKEHRLIKVGGGSTLGSISLCSFGQIRGHGFRFRVKIPKLANWSRRVEFLDKNKISYDVINKGCTQRIMFKGCKVWLSSKSLVIYFPKDLSFLGNTAADTEGRAFFEVVELLKGLDSLFNTSFKVNSKYQIKIFGKHQSDVGNGLAKLYTRDHRSIKVHNADGLWLLIDDSFNLSELETVGVSGTNDSTKDMDDVVKPFFNDLKEFPFTGKDFHNVYSLVKGQVAAMDSVVTVLATLVKPKPKVNKSESSPIDISECDYIG